MSDLVVVLMIKNNKTGFLEKEIAQYRVTENENLIVNLFGIDLENAIEVHMKLTTDRDVEDWEFSAIYDYYDDGVIKEFVKSVIPEEDCYNPTWEVVFEYDDKEAVMEEKIKTILDAHSRELEEVYNAIKEKKEEYKEC